MNNQNNEMNINTSVNKTTPLSKKINKKLKIVWHYLRTYKQNVVLQVIALV